MFDRITYRSLDDSPHVASFFLKCWGDGADMELMVYRKRCNDGNCRLGYTALGVYKVVLFSVLLTRFVYSSSTCVLIGVLERILPTASLDVPNLSLNAIDICQTHNLIVRPIPHPDSVLCLFQFEYCFRDTR